MGCGDSHFIGDFADPPGKVYYDAAGCRLGQLLDLWKDLNKYFDSIVANSP